MGFGKVCHQWRSLHNRMFRSYTSHLRTIDSTSLGFKGLHLVLSKGDHLEHVRALDSIVKRDFRCQVKFFSQNIVLQARVASRVRTTETGRLFESFKVKTGAINSRYNFFSDVSLAQLCR